MNEPNSKSSLRVYFIEHADGRRTGHLMRRLRTFFDPPAPTAYGETEEEVYGRIEAELQERIVRGDVIERYLWNEQFETRTVSLEVYPVAMIEQQPVVGARELPLRLTYAYAKTESGAFRVMLPRFEWWLVLESLDTAKHAISHAVAAAMLGAEPAWLYDFRREGNEYVREWAPPMVRDRTKKSSARVGEERPTLAAVADDWVERASKGKLPKPVGDSRLRPFWNAFKRTPYSALIVGGPGVGKTSEVQHLARILLQARRADEKDVPGLFATRADRLISGMIYVGMWQERMLKLVEELRHENEVLYVDRLDGLLRPQPDGASLADMLAPALAAILAIPGLGEFPPAIVVAGVAITVVGVALSSGALRGVMTRGRARTPGRS